MARRLLRRAAASWAIWVPLALAVSGLAAYRRARAPSRYEATVVLRATEGQVAIPGAGLGPGRLRAHVSDLVFTNARLLEVMRRHPASFPDLAQEPAEALDGFRKELQITVAQSDFSEERGDDDPPRSARVEVHFHAADPELALAIARELGDLVIESAFGAQRKAIERERAAAAAALAKAEGALQELAHLDPVGLEERTRAARARVVTARQQATASTLALRALDERQGLRFEVVDPGHAPVRDSPLAAALLALAVALPTAAVGMALLAGAFDPRVLDAEDVRDAGLAFLGPLPALPGPSPGGSGAGSPRV